MSAQQKGFTLIEFAIVIIILGILAAVFIPRITETKNTAISAVKQADSSIVNSAFALYIAEHQGKKPTVKQLANSIASNVAANKSTAATNGINITIGNHVYLVPTYTDIKCKTPTATTSDVVECVGEMS